MPSSDRKTTARSASFKFSFAERAVVPAPRTWKGRPGCHRRRAVDGHRHPRSRQAAEAPAAGGYVR